MKLTENFAKLQPPPPPGPGGKSTQSFYRDAELPGFGLRVSSGGTKSWILERRVRGKVKRITLGRCDMVSLQMAKARAIKLNREIARENAPRIRNGRIVKETILLADTFKLYLETHTELQALTLEDYQRSLLGPLKNWRYRCIRDISEQDVLAKRDECSAKNEARFNNAMRLLRAILNYARLHLISAKHKPIIKMNPVDILSRRNLWFTIKTKRVPNTLQTEQIKQWWQATLKLRKVTTCNYLHFLILTGLPQTIASRLTYQDIDFDKRLITYSNGNTSDICLNLPLTAYFHELFHKLAQQQPDSNSYLFPGLTTDKPISDPRTAIHRVQELSGICFNLTDLHHSFIKLAGQSGFDSSELKILRQIYRQKCTSLDSQDIAVIRKIQERVYLTVCHLIK